MTAGPISLAIFSNTQERGGAEEHILTLLRGLDRKFFRPHLICSPEVAGKLQPDLPSDVALYPLTLHSPFHWASAIRLAHYLRRQRVEILHSHLFYSSLFGSPIGRFCGVPVVIETPHLRECWRKGLKGHFFVDRLIGRCVDYYIAVSHANARFLVQGKRLPARKVRTIHNGSDLRRFAPVESSQPGLRAQLGFAPDDLVLLAAARLEPQKGHCVLLDALPLVRRDFPNVRLVCLGDGALRGQLERQVRDLRLSDAVRFVGYQTDIPRWLSLADVTVLPSFFEGLPLIAIESLAAERPMVATAVDGTPEVILDGRTGFTVPPGDAPSLAEAIGRLLRDPDLRRRFGRAGRSFVLEHFTQERQVAQTQQLYFDALRQRAARLFPAEGVVESGAAKAAG
jgi:glycosyltransferase involved in cell wall biosynthesis